MGNHSPNLRCSKRCSRNIREVMTYQSYTNHFDGYETEYRVYNEECKECIIRWANVSPVEVKIPYQNELAPDELRRVLHKILERAEDITYEEYPFRGRYLGDNTVEVYWTVERIIKVDVIVSDIKDAYVAFEIGKNELLDNLKKLEENIIDLVNTMKY